MSKLRLFIYGDAITPARFWEVKLVNEDNYRLIKDLQERGWLDKGYASPVEIEKYAECLDISDKFNK